MRSLLFAGSVLVVACGSSSETPTGASGSGGTAGSAGAAGAAGDGGSPGLICPASGVSKRPWAQRVDGTSALLRWEACSSDSADGVTLTPEGGGSALSFSSTDTPFTVNNTYTAPLNSNAQPDFAGDYVMHEAALGGLAAGTCYTYALEADSNLTGRVCTSPASGTPFSFLAIADTNPGLSQAPQKILEHIKSEPWDFTVHGGDISYYASGLDTWAYWFVALDPVLARGAFLPSIGNHESEKPDEYDQYYTRFFGKSGFDGTDSYYRFEHGGVWFFAINTEDSLDAGSTQIGWLTTQLQDAASKPGYRFSVVFFHRPFLTCGDASQENTGRSLMTPVFEATNVKLVLQGHMHGYERFVVPYTSDASKTITYVTVAGGGGALGNIDENITRPECSMRKASAKSYFFTLIDVGATDISGHSVKPDGTELDPFTQAID